MTVVLALLLDALIGEPRAIWSRVPHPAVLMGRCISWFDTTLNRGHARKAKGVVTVAVLSLSAIGLGAAVSSTLGVWGEVVLGAVLLAQRSLVQHVQAVGDALRLSLGDGRRAVAMIVGRDTQDMSPSDVARSAIESAAENLSDGVTAPAVWFVLFGLKGLLFYKIINTADSMIGYRTPRHQDFGWAAARLDDALNWVPARLTAAIIWTLGGIGAWATITLEAGKHRSPNAGWPESAMAYRLDVALSGPRSYFGTKSNDPFVNDLGQHDLTARHIDLTVRVLWQTWGVLVLLAAIAALAN